jgi:hypothetical protein
MMYDGNEIWNDELRWEFDVVVRFDAMRYDGNEIWNDEQHDAMRYDGNEIWNDELRWEFDVVVRFDAKYRNELMKGREWFCGLVQIVQRKDANRNILLNGNICNDKRDK